jgi:hypothetical protein
VPAEAASFVLPVPPWLGALLPEFAKGVPFSSIDLPSFISSLCGEVHWLKLDSWDHFSVPLILVVVVSLDSA